MRIALSRATVGTDAGQLINMLFGNTSLQDDVILHDVEFPDDVVAGFDGPHLGLDGLRKRAGAGARALTCSALKPQGLSPARLGDLAARFAQGGIDYIKDDHGLADQAYSPFATRCEAVARALRATGQTARYVPSLTGDLDALRIQIAAARNAGIDTVMVQPMIMGLSNFTKLVSVENPGVAFFAHPTLAEGVAHRAPGAAVRRQDIPHAGGRRAGVPTPWRPLRLHAADTCRDIARTGLQSVARPQGLRGAGPGERRR